MLTPFGRSLLDRRDLLGSLPGVALAALLAEQGLLAEDGGDKPRRSRGPHFPPKAKRVLMLFCSGALSHIDTFDYKPELVKRSGQPMPGADKLVTFQGANGNLVGPLWTFRPRGQSGKMVSDLLPHLAGLADEMAFVHSLTARSNTHGPAENQMSTGFTLDGFPSVGAWVTYALGSEAADLPAFVAVPDPRGVPQTGPNCWGSGFLPAAFQGTPLTADKPIPHLDRPKGVSPDADAATRGLVKLLDERHLGRHPGDAALAARIAGYETAARMQLRAPEAADLARESAETHRLYGTDDPNKLTAAFARNCLLARRLLERGVRFVEVFNGSYAMGEGVGNWDGHRKLKEQYETHAAILDRPAAALLTDLKRTGLLADTLVVFVTEFGRMPTFQKGANGRDHNPHGFTAWLAGAGVRRGVSYGATDEFGHKAATDPCTIYDLHATILHLCGLDHERLTVYHNGTHRRLTDVHGRVLGPLLA
jgi:uncharacterized protein (DUF1501 family)